VNNWDPKQHPRDPNNGQFTDSWAGAVIGQMGLADPEFEAAQQRQHQWVLDTFDMIDAVLGEPGQNQYWLADHYEGLNNMLRAGRTSKEFERDPRLAQAHEKMDKFMPWTGPPLPWQRGTEFTEEQMMAAHPYWRGEVARLLRREGYDLDAVEAHFRQAGKTHLLTDETGYREFNRVDPPRLMVKFLTKELEKETASASHLRIADIVYDAQTNGEHGGKQMKAVELDEHSDFASSGDYEIWLDGAWHQLEEVYRDDPDEEEIEIMAGDQHLMIDTSDDIELRRATLPRRRAWWE
jgi:hypothetical protein